MAIASSAEIDNLSGNKTIYNTAGTDITSTVLADAVARGDADVKLYTGVTNWDTSDPIYPAVQEAAEYFGASYVLMRYAKNDNEIAKESKMYYDKAVALCLMISQSSTAAVYISSKPYKSYPINRDTGTIHSSLQGSDVSLDPSVGV